MSVNLGELLRTVEPVSLGARVRDARTARGLTQVELAGDDINVSYVCRIETGKRRPQLRVLRTLAERLGVSTEQLLLGDGAVAHDEIRLGLDYAELALETGEAAAAEQQAREQLAHAEKACLDDLTERARHLLGRALEANGQTYAAIEQYEALLGSASGLVAIRVGIALSRCYRDSDDLSLAIEIGERVQASIADAELAQTDEAVQLAVTVAAAYAKRGDLTHALRLATNAVGAAEQLSSPIARASAYWNASIFQADRGQVREAVSLAERALALLAEGRDERNLARMKRHLGQLQLEQQPPAVGAALANLIQCREEMARASASKADLSSCDTDLARAHLLAGDAPSAAAAAAEALANAPAGAGVIAAEASILLAQARLTLGQIAAADTACRDAAQALEVAAGASRSAAQLWRELADLFKRLGDGESAWTALTNATDAGGITLRPGATGCTTDGRAQCPDGVGVPALQAQQQ